MNYPLISEYIESIKSAEDNFNKLKNLRPVWGEDGEPVLSSGNFAVVFKMKDEQSGKLYAIKCFLKEQEGRAEAYRQISEELKSVTSPFLTTIKYLDKELFVDTNNTSEDEFPVLLMDWVEGKTLDQYIIKLIESDIGFDLGGEDDWDDTPMNRMSSLIYEFSRLAIWLLQQPFAHGDLKPDNILVKNDRTLVLVDYDGMYVPSMKGQKARELGSPDFRHPLRTQDEFDERIDDFSVISILLSLEAIFHIRKLKEEYGLYGKLLFSERDYRDIGNCIILRDFFPSKGKELNRLISIFTLVCIDYNVIRQKDGIILFELKEFYNSYIHYAIEDYALRYNALGIGNIPIRGNLSSKSIDTFKNPIEGEFMNSYYNWKIYGGCHGYPGITGLGTFLYENNLMAIDIDNLYDDKSSSCNGKDREELVSEFISKCLNLLGLPADYEWTMVSGSGKGIHILFYLKEVMGFGDIKAFTYGPNNKYRYKVDGIEYKVFENIDFLADSFLVLPPSISRTGRNYEFYHNKFPSRLPYTISANIVNKMLNYFCQEIQTFELYADNATVELFEIGKIRANGSLHGSSYSVDEFEDWRNSCDENDYLMQKAMSHYVYLPWDFDGVDAPNESDLQEIVRLYREANNPYASYNIAILIASGIVNGNKTDVRYYLNKCSGIIESKYLDKLKQLMESMNDN